MSILSALQFHNEAAAVAHLEAIVWPNVRFARIAAELIALRQ